MLILVLVPAFASSARLDSYNPGRSWESKEHWHRCPVLAEAALRRPQVAAVLGEL